MLRQFRHFALAACLAACAAPARGQGPSAAASSGQTLKQLSIEELGKIDVTSASRHAEPVGEAAAAVTVITPDDIRRAGVTTLPDALRLVTGVQVARINGQTWAISARGFNIAPANKLVVLIDGRSVYTPLFSGVFWDVQDVLLEDIDRIEVIRGPAGALWGANAVNGVDQHHHQARERHAGRAVHVGAGTPIGQTERPLRRASRAATARTASTASSGICGAQVFSDSGEQRARRRSAAGRRGFRFDREDTSKRTSFTLQGDVYRGASGLVRSARHRRRRRATCSARIVHTRPSGAPVAGAAVLRRHVPPRPAAVRRAPRHGGRRSPVPLPARPAATTSPPAPGSTSRAARRLRRRSSSSSRRR